MAANSKSFTDPTAADYAEAAALRETLRTFHRRSDDITTSHGLTSRTYLLLLMVKTACDGSEQAGLAELVDRLHLGKSTVTELVLRTEQRGLVRRELDPDRLNSLLVRLTSTGERRLAAALAALGDERRTLIHLVSKLR